MIVLWLISKVYVIYLYIENVFLVFSIVHSAFDN